MEGSNALEKDSPQTSKTSFTTLTFKDDCEIQEFADQVLVNGKGPFSYKNRPIFKNETGESVFEYSGLASDGNKVRSWAKVTLEPQGYSTLHYHLKGIEVYYITSKNPNALVTIDSREHHLTTGDCIMIKPGQHHQVKNLSSKDSLELHVKCTPPWTLEDFKIPEKTS